MVFLIAVFTCCYGKTEYWQSDTISEYGNVNGTNKQLTKVHTRCKSMEAAAQWVVDISRCDADDAGIEFDCEARDKKSRRSQIKIGQTAAFYSSY